MEGDRRGWVMGGKEEGRKGGGGEMMVGESRDVEGEGWVRGWRGEG